MTGLLSCPKCTLSFATDIELARHLVGAHAFGGDEAMAAASHASRESRQGQGGGPANRSGLCGYCKHPDGRHGAACPKANLPEVSVMGKWTCTKCGGKGHTSRSRTCPQWGTGAAPVVPLAGHKKRKVKTRATAPTHNGNGHDPLVTALTDRIEAKRAELAKLEAALEALA